MRWLALGLPKCSLIDSVNRLVDLLDSRGLASAWRREGLDLVGPQRPGRRRHRLEFWASQEVSASQIVTETAIVRNEKQMSRE